MSFYIYIYGIGVIVGIAIGISIINSIYNDNELDGSDILLYGVALPLASWAFVVTMLLYKICFWELKKY